MESMNGQNSYLFLVLLLISTIAGCEYSGFKKDSDGLRNIIPTSELDRAPKNPKDVSQVQDAVPKFEKRTAAGNVSPYKVKGVVYRVMNDPTGYEAYGAASWYGEKFHGNRTSNGEVYDMYEMTAAHKTLPIPSYVRVTNLENGKSIVVRVNDRGPFAHGRIIDLSYAGAYKLDFLREGTAKVKVEYIDPLSRSNDDSSNADLKSPTKPELTSTAPVQEATNISAEIASNNSAKVAMPFLQLAAFSERSAALAMQTRVNAHSSWPVLVEPGKNVSGTDIYRVFMGPLPDEETLEKVKAELMQKGLSEPLRLVR